MPSTLYRSNDAFYLVPDDVRPATGALEVRALSGAAIHVDPAAMASYRVTEAVARRMAGVELMTFTQRMDQTLDAAQRLLEQTTGAQGSAIEQLSVQLEQLVATLQRVNLGSESGQAEVANAIRALDGVDRMAALESTKASNYAGLAELLADLQRDEP